VAGLHRHGPPLKVRHLMGMGRLQSVVAVAVAAAVLPLPSLLQQRWIERHYLRVFWGSDAVALFENAWNVNELLPTAAAHSNG
jgi:hypothetical protein